jgi:hypothetical protein
MLPDHERPGEEVKFMFWKDLFRLAIQVLGAVVAEALFDGGRQRGRHRRR